MGYCRHVHFFGGVIALDMFFFLCSEGRAARLLGSEMDTLTISGSIATNIRREETEPDHGKYGNKTTCIKKQLTSMGQYNIIASDLEKSRSWSSAHDWKSCNRQKRFEGSNPSFSVMVYSLNRSAPEKRRNSPFFCVFRRFSHFFQTDKMSEIKRSGRRFSGGRKDSNAFER